MNTKRITLSAMLCAVAVVGSLLSFPIFGSKCAPVQHIVNIVCAVTLGPWGGLAVAFSASLIRNLFGIGSILAFPGSMFGALLCGFIYKKTQNISATLIAEVFGTAVLGGLCAYPIAILFMGDVAAGLAFYVYVAPFFISTAVGSIMSTVVVVPLLKTGIAQKV